MHLIDMQRRWVVFCCCIVLCCLVVLCCVVLHWLRLGGWPARSDTFLCGVSLWLSSTSTWICPSVENLQHEAETLCSPLNLLSLTSGPTLPSDLHYSACLWLTILSCIWHNSWVSKSSLDLWLTADWIWLKKSPLIIISSITKTSIEETLVF